MTDAPTIMGLSDPEAAVLACVQACLGMAQAKPVDQVAEETGVDPRVVQKIVKHLIERHRCAIGSATGDPHGYYWIATADEQGRAEQQLKNRIIHTAQRLAALKKNTPDEILGQIRMELTT